MMNTILLPCASPTCIKAIIRFTARMLMIRLLARSLQALNATARMNRIHQGICTVI